MSLPDEDQILVLTSDTGNVKTGSDVGAVLPSFTTIGKDAISAPKSGAGIYESTQDDINFFYRGRWNPLTTELILSAASFVNQEPSAVDTALKIEYGAAQVTDPVSLAVDGTITINEDGFYWTVFGIQYGRTNTNLSAIIHFRTLINGTQVGGSATSIMRTDASDRPLSVTIGAFLSSGDKITAEVIRDSAGVNDGGLLTASVTAAGWTDSPSASIRIYR